MKTVNIFVKDCKYYLPYAEGYDYSELGGDCDHMDSGKMCHPNRCPINTYLRKAHNIEIDSYEPEYDSLP